jgi:PST family polysaccharide transporter
VPLLFGPQWGAAVFPTQVLCGVGAFKALVCSVGTIFVSKGRPDIELKLNLFGAVKLVPFLLIGVQWGLNGVAVALLLSSLTGAPLQQYFANRLLGLPVKTYLKALTVPSVATAALAVMLLAYRWAGLSWGLADWQLLAGAVPLAAATYLGAITALGCDWRGLVRQVAGRPEPKVS